MAKLNYSTPLFRVCPIPLIDNARPCYMLSNNTPGMCIVTDRELGDVFFAESNQNCFVIVDDSMAGIFCFEVPNGDQTVYHS